MYGLKKIIVGVENVQTRG